MPQERPTASPNQELDAEIVAHTSVYTLRVKVPRNPHPWYKRRGQ